jgi:hypothetical protein
MVTPVSSHFIKDDPRIETNRNSTEPVQNFPSFEQALFSSVFGEAGWPVPWYSDIESFGISTVQQQPL